MAKHSVNLDQQFTEQTARLDQHFADQATSVTTVPAPFTTACIMPRAPPRTDGYKLKVALAPLAHASASTDPMMTLTLAPSTQPASPMAAAWTSRTISFELVVPPHLTDRDKLDLHYGTIAGPVPTLLGFLPDLHGVYLFNNYFFGTLPISIGGCIALHAFEASNNHLTGMVPAAITNSTRLIRLNPI